VGVSLAMSWMIDVIVLDPLSYDINALFLLNEVDPDLAELLEVGR
jgi:hypothetical protein